MQIDSLNLLGNAIQAAFEAAVYPLMLVIVVALLVSAVAATRSYMRERRKFRSAPSATTI